MDNKPPEQCEPEDFLVKAEKYGIPQARHRMLILGIWEDIQITPKTLQESEATTVAQAIGDLPKIRSAVSKEPDTLELWRKILDSITSKAWCRNGRSNGLSQTVKKIDEALVSIRQRKLTTGAESMSYTGRPKIFSDWYRHGCVDVVTNHAGRGHMRSDLRLLNSPVTWSFRRNLFIEKFAECNYI